MKITTNSPTPVGKTYNDRSTLKPNWFYEDKDGDLVITDWSGKPACVVKITDPDDNAVFDKGAVAWPLHDTKISKVTVTR